MKVKHSLILFLTALLITVGPAVYAQTQIVNFVRGGVSDGEKLIEAYLKPLGYAMGADLNGGWYNTARVHNTLGFDVTFTLTSAFVPKADKTFDLSALDFELLSLKEPDQSPYAPTFAGSRDKGPALQLVTTNPADGSKLVLTEFQSHNGIDIPVYPLPMVKAGIGLPFGIELMGRFLPRIVYEDMSLGLWGAGIKYDITQHIPVLRKLPALNISAMGAYTKLHSSAGISFQKGIYGEEVGGIPVNGGQEHYNNQNLNISMQGLTAMALASIDLPVVSIFGGMGYSRSLTSVKLLGDYPLIKINNTTGEVFIDDVNNPINLEFDNFSGLQATLGARLKFTIITLHVDYTYANYNLLTAGLGVSIR